VWRADDQVALKGREVYLHLPNGFSGTKLPPMLMERLVGTTGTSRNWNTVTRLAEMAAG
jgi:uncharacterized protein (DUF1697 family)